MSSASDSEYLFLSGSEFDFASGFCFDFVSESDFDFASDFISNFGCKSASKTSPPSEVSLGAEPDNGLIRERHVLAQKKRMFLLIIRSKINALRTDGWTDGWTDRRMDGWTDEGTDGYSDL